MENVNIIKAQKLARIVFGVKQIEYIPTQRVTGACVDHKKNEIHFHLATGGTLTLKSSVKR